MTTSFTVLGLGCGQPRGSAEILLKAALRAAQDQGARVELVRLDELRWPSGAAEGTEPDDAWWLWGTPRAMVLDAAALDRAAMLGRNVASQLGVPFEAARYLGPPGLCPMCHLDVVVLYDADVECATCGARGHLGHDLTVIWTDLSTSVISMDEKRAHAAEIQATAERLRAVRAEIDDRAREFEAYDPVVRPAPLPGSESAGGLHGHGVLDQGDQGGLG